jgi:hypothetical protein
MHDDRGVYYYPNTALKTTRMYVREQDGALEFRLFSSEDPQIWERHQWLPLSVIQEAARQYPGDKNPLLLYDEQVAREVLRQAREKEK